MNVFNKVTLQSLKKNKTRTVVTIIGIALSAAMICAVTTFVSSMYNYMLQKVVYDNGDWHGCVTDSTWSVYDTVSNSTEIKSAVYAQQLGYAVAEGCVNEYKPYIYLLGASEGFEDVMPIHITSGRYPSSQNEILLPDHLYENGGVKYSLGDTLTLSLGERMLEGYALWQNNPRYVYEEGQEMLPPEEIAVRETREYTVAGFYARPSFENYTAPGYTAITLADIEQTQLLCSVYFKMKKAGDIYDFMNRYSISGDTNTDVLMYSGVSRYDNFSTMLTGLASIVIALIMFGSISLIYNAFSISVSERTKQFGLLSSIGATKKQLRSMVLFEAFAVSAVGIPLGILVGIGGIGVTLMIIGHKFQSLMSYEMPLRVNVSLLSVIIAIAVALVTVLISAWIPSRRATKISAVEAIRQTRDINAKEKEVRTSKLTYKLFGLPGMLASKHYKRSRKKYRATVVSLFMSIVLFVSASAFCEYLMESVTGSFSFSSSDLVFTCGSDEFDDISEDELLELLGSKPGVTDAAYAKNFTICVSIDEGCFTDRALEGIGRAGVPLTIEGDKVESYVQFVFVNDAEYGKLLEDYSLDPAVYADPNAPLGVMLDGNVVFDQDEGRYISLEYMSADSFSMYADVPAEHEGYYYSCSIYYPEDGTYINRYVNRGNADDVLDVPVEESTTEFEINVGSVIYDDVYYINRYGDLAVIYPYRLIDAVLPNMNASNNDCSFYFLSDDNNASNDAIKRALNDNGFSGKNLNNYGEYIEENRNIVTIIQVFAYGFIVLISLIAAANVFNTITTNINLRRREFAMLRSVGMSQSGLNRMMNYECLLYGSRALMLGLPVSAVITFFIYMSVSEGYQTNFRLPWEAIGIAVLSVFAVVFATMMYSMSRIRKDNPIDALKNENL